VYQAPDSDVSFGDVFLSDSVFHDAYLMGDAANMGAYTLRGGAFKEKFVAGIGRTLSRPVEAPAEGFQFYSPAIPLGTEESGLLAHGLPTHAIVLSDDCDIEEAFGRGGAPPRGRLLFAAVTELPESVIGRLGREEPFDRFPLPKEDPWAGGAVELRRLFMVDVRAVNPDPGARAVSLDRELATRLAVTWSAYATRRGPLAAAKNAGKVAQLLVDGGTGEDEATSAANALAQTVARAWTFEVDGLDAAAIAFDEQTDPERAKARLIETLRDLAHGTASLLRQLEEL